MGSALPGQVYSASDMNLIDNCPVTDANGVIAGRAAFAHVLTSLRAGVSNIGADGIAGTLTAANFLGVVVRTMAGSFTTTAAAGFAANTIAPIMRAVRTGGRIWGESAGSLTGGAGTIAVGDSVYCVVANLVAGNTAPLLTFTNAAITGAGNTDTIALTGCTFQSVCAATPGLPVLIELAASLSASSQVLVGIGDPGAAGVIPVTQSGTIGLVTASGLVSPEAARTLAAPTFAGQALVISLKTKGTAGANGDTSVVVAAAIDGTHTTVTFANQGDAVKLFAVASGAAFAWRLEAVVGATLS
jgi:hypothetical protein